MNRYLLDTNILVRLVTGEHDRISPDIFSILQDYENQLYVSSVSIMELIELHRIGKIDKKRKKFKVTEDLVKVIENEFNIVIKSFAKEHALTLSKLQVIDNHNDPFDHVIISHAITEKLILVSSDTKFKHYTTQKLNFVFNKR